MIFVPSPAISIIGRHNSGKTTMIEKLIRSLTERGCDVGSIKHHTHGDFDIDYPGKDSYRHRAAGATETVIAAPHKMARVKSLSHELECDEILRTMPGHDIVVVEGYRKSGLPSIELMRYANEADRAVAAAFAEAAKSGRSLGEDFIQESRGEHAHARDLAEKMPTSDTVAVITDIPEAVEAARIYGIPAFGIEDIAGITDYLERHFVRPRVSVVIQAGGESRRMGMSKARVLFDGRPLILRMIERLAPIADELIITTNEADKLGFISEADTDCPIRLVADVYDVRGALPGLYTAFQAASNPYVAIVACDMVFASPTLVVAEALEMAKTEADVVVPVNKHGFEPFHAMYRKESCTHAAKLALDAGSSRAQSIFDDPDLKVCEFSQARVLEAEPRGGCFINANTPDELQRIQDAYLGE